MTVTVIGVDGTHLPPGAAAAMQAAELVVGTRAHLDAHAPDSVRTAELGEVGPLVAELAQVQESVVLAAGDPGFFGIVRALRTHGVRLTVLPAITGVQRLLASIGRPWDDVTIVDGRDLGAAVNVCRARPAVAVLTGPDVGPAELAFGLAGWRRTLVVAEDDGTVSTMDLTAAANRSWKQPALVLSLTDVDVVPAGDWISGGRLVPAGWALPEDDFATRDGKITSTEVRALALAKLAPRLGTLVWDVAAASGAVAVESARLGAAALAVERDPVQCVRILANSSAHGVDVRVVEAELLAAISGLPRPDSIFLGGGGEAVMRACTTVEASRVVVALNSLDRVVPARDALRGAGYKVDGCQLSAARLGDGGKLSAVDPMTLVWGVK